MANSKAGHEWICKYMAGSVNGVGRNSRDCRSHTVDMNGSVVEPNLVRFLSDTCLYIDLLLVDNRISHSVKIEFGFL